MSDIMRTSFATFLLCLLALPALAQSPGPQGSEGSKMREQEWRIPGPGGSLMVATVFRPAGSARTPLMVMNHGSLANADERRKMTRPHFTAISSYFVALGYTVVLPLRRSYGAIGGVFAEDYGSCDRPDYFNAGLQTAADIRAAVDFMRAQSSILPDRTIVIGQSGGGWGTLALSSLNPPGVPAMINFAGGRGGHAPIVGNCAPDALVKAAASYGTTARVPLLWINAENDSYFGPKLVNRMVEAYGSGGGRVVHRQVSAFGRDGHSLAGSDAGAPVWQPLVEQFLKGI